MSDQLDLDKEFYSSALDEEVTLRDYFQRLLLTLWEEGAGFSGKRPFGNSGWEAELASDLVEAGMLAGAFDDDGYLEDYNRKGFNESIVEAILRL